MHILLVDDEVEFLEVLSKRLRKRNIQVTEAGSGRAALEAAGQGTDFDVVVLDMKMPDMDGLTTLKGLKRVNPKLEVLILTGHADMEAAVQGMELGAFDYMVKPVGINELIFKLEDAARKRRAG